ncbi:MAG: hydrogenase [Acidocella sp.]|nr:hydrogenase [Acidocella sp.]
MNTDTLSPSLRRLLQMPGITALGQDDVENFTAQGLTALFFTGNVTRYPEIDDLAVVLPELLKEFPGMFRVGIIDPDVEKKLAVRFKISVRPTLLFLRDGAVVLSLPRMRDWAVYIEEISKILSPEQAA